MLKKYFILLGVVIVSACDNVKHTFGLTHNQPDEFSVTENPPLTVPKDYHLRAPEVSSTNTTLAVSTEQSTEDSAKKALDVAKHPKKKTSSAPSSTTLEKNIVDNAKGKDTVDENIRDILNEDTTDKTDQAKND
jgi:hypothetical protein